MLRDNGGIKWITQGAADWKSPCALKSSGQCRILSEGRSRKRPNGKAAGQRMPVAVKKGERLLHTTDRSELIWRPLLRKIPQAYLIPVIFNITCMLDPGLNACLIVHSSIDFLYEFRNCTKRMLLTSHSWWKTVIFTARRTPPLSTYCLGTFTFSTKLTCELPSGQCIHLTFLSSFKLSINLTIITKRIFFHWTLPLARMRQICLSKQTNWTRAF